MQILFLCFLTIPVVEMWLLIEVGSLIGTLPTIGFVLLTAVIGVTLLKKQGLSTFLKANQKMNAGQMPVAEMGEGLMLAVAGALLLTPGFVTDSIGFILLTPGLRSVIAKVWLKKVIEKTNVSSFSSQSDFSQRTFTQNVYSGQSSNSFRPAREQEAKRKPPDIIDGDFQEVTRNEAEALKPEQTQADNKIEKD